MKKSLFIFSLISFGFVKSQMFINGTSTTSKDITNNSVLVEFQNGVNKGIILPWTNGEVASPANGTFILDTKTNKVKVYTNNSWADLSNNAKTTNNIDTSLQLAPNTEKPLAKVVVGDLATAPNGILVLESTKRALVLPKVEAPHTNIIQPAF